MENKTGTKNINKLLLGLIVGIILGGVIFSFATYYYFRSTNNSEIENVDNVTENEDNKNDNVDNNSDEKETSNTIYNLEDYIEVSDRDPGLYRDWKISWEIKEIKFKNMPLGTTVEFLRSHNKFINPFDRELEYSNNIICEINKNVLSIYNTEETKNPPGKSYINGTQLNYYSLNIDLDTKKIITNAELINIYNLNMNSIYEKILENIVLTVKTEKFALDVNGYINVDYIEVSDFEKNISEYAEILNNRYDIFTLYVKNNQVNLVYNQHKILNLIGMGTHNGLGLVEDQTIILN